MKKMSIIYLSRGDLKAVAVAVSVLLSFVGMGWADQFERNPITETQTKGVLVTEESLKNYEKKPGAPAPTFKIVSDTAKFFVSEPFDMLKDRKKSNWSLIGNSEEEVEGKKSAQN